MQKATIEQLKINPSKKLNNTVKAQLVKMIEHEFYNKSTLINASISQQKEDILNKYKKSVGFEVMGKALDQAELERIAANEKIDKIKEKMALKGLNQEGEILSDYEMRFKSKVDQTKASKARATVEKLLSIVNDNESGNLQAKIIARMWLSDTNGEAAVILHQVLGNGLIPAFTMKELSAPGEV